jgi:pimeloyl-ACP methyl ester carboxylesterase
VLADPLESFGSALANLTDRERRLIESPEFSAILLDSMREGLRQGAAGALDDLLSWPAPFEVDLAGVTCPVSAFHGSADNWEPLKNLQRVLDRLPNSQIIAAQDLNHFAPDLFPQVVLALTR